MRRSCCARAMGRSVPSRESRTRRRCCLSPKTICVVRETAPFSLSLCCTKSDRRIVWLLQANPFPGFSRDRTFTAPFERHTTEGAGAASLWLQRIMFRVRDAVKFGACGMCPMCNSGLRSPAKGTGANPDCPREPFSFEFDAGANSAKEPDDVGISGTQGRTGAFRTDVRARTGTAGRVVGQNHERARSRGAAWSVLHQRAESDGSGDGPAHDQPGARSRERAGAIGDGRIAEREANTGKSARPAFSTNLQRKFFSWLSDGNFAGVPRKFRALAPLPRRLRANLQKRI